MKSVIPFAFAVAASLPVPLLAEPDVERGAYLAQIMDCGGCHTPRGPDGAPEMDRPLQGATVGFEIPGLGIFWPPNLTDHATGLADWSDEEIDAAIRGGVRPDGRQLAPIMPYASYATLTDEDAAALVAFLRSLPGAENAVPAPVPAGGAAPAPYFAFALPK